jgi:hypothetical protein
MHLQENDIQNDICAVHELLNQIDGTEGNALKKMILMNELFFYLSQHPRLIQQFEFFRATVIGKMCEMLEEAEMQKAIADPEGGEVNESLMYAATLLECTIGRLALQIGL